MTDFLSPDTTLITAKDYGGEPITIKDPLDAVKQIQELRQQVWLLGRKLEGTEGSRRSWEACAQRWIDKCERVKTLLVTWNQPVAVIDAGHMRARQECYADLRNALEQ